jgi:hypothetical protein
MTWSEGKVGAALLAAPAWRQLLRGGPQPAAAGLGLHAAAAREASADLRLSLVPRAGAWRDWGGSGGSGATVQVGA